MGTTCDDGSQQAMWVATADLPQGGGHPFYERLNEILGAAGFDAFVEKLCAPFYARMGRPSLAPGRYFRLLLVGYFEGLDSERAIAWRAADSLNLRSFLRLAAPASPPDHSTISRTRRLRAWKPIRRSSPGCCSSSWRRAWSAGRRWASTRRRWRRMRRCGASSAARRARTTRRS